MDLVSRALHFAVDAHSGARRKGSGEPMALHAMEAAAVASSLTADEEVVAAAALHDTVEDAGVTLETLENQFGPRVAALVAAETENKRAGMPPETSWMLRKREAVAIVQQTDDLAVKMVFLGDKLSNMRSFYRLKQQYGPEMWRLFHQQDPEAHHWYYRAIADAMPELRDTLAWREYDGLIRAVFGEE